VPKVPPSASMLNAKILISLGVASLIAGAIIGLTTLVGSGSDTSGGSKDEEFTLGASNCQQSLYRCEDIGVRNVPAYSFQAPKTEGGGLFGRRLARKSKTDDTATDTSTAEASAASGNCLQYCIPTQNSMAIKGTLKAKLGYCCSSGYNNFQGSIYETVPGMADIAIWQYEHGESQF